MKDIVISVTAGATVAALWAFVAWCNGFNFDHRGPDVAEYVVLATICSVSTAGGVFYARKGCV